MIGCSSVACGFLSKSLFTCRLADYSASAERKPCQTLRTLPIIPSDILPSTLLTITVNQLYILSYLLRTPRTFSLDTYEMFIPLPSIKTLLSDQKLARNIEIVK